MKLLYDGELEEEREREGHNSWAVADGECYVGFDHGAAKGVSVSRRSSLIFVRLTVRFLLPLTFEGCANLPHAFVRRVLAVFTRCIAAEWL